VTVELSLAVVASVSVPLKDMEELTSPGVARGWAVDEHGPLLTLEVAAEPSSSCGSSTADDELALGVSFALFRGRGLICRRRVPTKHLQSAS
jgi:hypothetical protein